MSDGDFSERMKRVPDEELFYVVSSDGFQPEAVAAAKAEIMRRQIDPGEAVRLRSDIEFARAEDEDRPNHPLGIAQKAMFLIFWPFMLFTLPAVFVLGYRGYTRKRREALMFMLYGFGAYALISVPLRLFVLN